MMMNNPYEMLRQLQSNPMALLSQKFKIPSNIQTPQDIIQHLLNTGQVTQEQVNRAMQMRRMIFREKKVLALKMLKKKSKKDQKMLKRALLT